MAIEQLLCLEPITFYVASINNTERWVRQQVWDKGIKSITGRALIDDDNRRSLYHQIQFFASDKQIKENKLVEQLNGNFIKDDQWDYPVEIADFRLRPITYRSPDGIVLGERPRRLLQLIWGAEDILDGIDWYKAPSWGDEQPSNEEVYKAAKSPRKI